MFLAASRSWQFARLSRAVCNCVVTDAEAGNVKATKISVTEIAIAVTMSDVRLLLIIDDLQLGIEATVAMSRGIGR